MSGIVDALQCVSLSSMHW